MLFSLRRLIETFLSIRLANRNLKICNPHFAFFHLFFRREQYRVMRQRFRSVLYMYEAIGKLENCHTCRFQQKFFTTLVSLACGAMSSENCTYLVQSSVTTTDPNPCTYTICKCSPNVCRMRLDFTVRKNWPRHLRRNAYASAYSLKLNHFHSLSYPVDADHSK